MKKKFKDVLLVGLLGLTIVGAFSVITKSLNDWINSSSEVSTITSDNTSNSEEIIFSSHDDNTSSSEEEIEKYILQVGTYKWLDIPTFPNEYEFYTEDIQFQITQEDEIYNIIAIEYGFCAGGNIAGNAISYKYLSLDYDDENPYWYINAYHEKGNVWGDNAQTITLKTNQEVSQEFYDWFKANTLKTYTLPTAEELGITADGYTVAQGDIEVTEEVYNAITELNNDGSLADFGKTCGLTIPSNMKPFYKMGARLIQNTSTYVTPDISVHAPEIGLSYFVDMTIENLDKDNQNNVHLIEFYYSKNYATYKSINAENVDVENHVISFSPSSADGSSLILLCHEEPEATTTETELISDSVNQYTKYDDINSYISLSTGGDVIQSIDLEDIRINDLNNYSDDVKNLICLWNNPNSELQEDISFIPTTLNIEETRFVTYNSGDIIKVTDYQCLLSFVKFAITGNVLSDVEFCVRSEEIKELNKDDIIAIIINKSGELQFCDLKDYDPEYGECTIESSLIEDGSVITFATKTIINFKIGETTYQAKNDMTWNEWVNSDYNTDEFYVSDTRIKKNFSVGTKSIKNSDNSFVSNDEMIISNNTYSLSTPVGGGGGNN